ncbi:MAG: agmatinase [Oscillospiraceae bacterium]|nr:agmatinase [Oscillospiraceae bacterium]
MLNKNIESAFGCAAEYQDATTVLFGAPFDSTTSFRPGARFGSRAIRQESYGLESYSPYQQADLVDLSIFDSGDLELPFGAPEQALEAIRARTATILADGKRPFLLGGEHLVTLGAVQAAAERRLDLHIIHFDAHADLRDEYLGVTLSHASVIRRCWDLLGNGRISQFGIRSGDRAEFAWAEGRVHTQLFDFTGLGHVLDTLTGKPVYLTVDLDVLDPSIFPGTGTPEAGGVGFSELLQALLLVISQANVVACDVNELAPALDPSGVSTAVACKVVREMLIALG